MEYQRHPSRFRREQCMFTILVLSFNSLTIYKLELGRHDFLTPIFFSGYINDQIYKHDKYNVTYNFTIFYERVDQNFF